MRHVHPAYDPSTATWFTTGALRAEAPSLEKLQDRLPADVVIVGRVVVAPGAPIPRYPFEFRPDLQDGGKNRHPLEKGPHSSQSEAPSAPAAEPPSPEPPAPTPVPDRPLRPLGNLTGPEVRGMLPAGIRLYASEEHALALLLTRERVTREQIARVSGLKASGSVDVAVSRLRQKTGLVIQGRDGGWTIPAESRREFLERMR